MENKLIKKEENSFLNKIKLFLLKIFSKKSIEIQKFENTDESNVNTNIKFQKELEKNVIKGNEKEYQLKEFLREIEQSPNIIENLSNDRLDKLIEYYVEITNSKMEKIKRLKATLN